MKLVNATTGKIGIFVVGPKHYLHETISLGQIALCIARDDRHTRPCVWLIGGIDQLIDYVSLARSKGELEEDIATMLLARIDEAKKAIPTSALERLASAMGVEVEELKEGIQIAQACISDPIEGVRNFSGAKTKWIAKTATHASIH